MQEYINVYTGTIAFVIVFASLGLYLYRRDAKKKKKEDAKIASLRRVQTKNTQEKVSVTNEPEKPKNYTTIVLKSPGKQKGNYGYYKVLLRKKNISFTHAKEISSAYVAYKNQPGRKRAKGHWEYVVEYTND